MSETPDFITVKEACAVVGGTKPISKPTYYRGVKAGRLPAPEHPTPGVSRVRRAKLIAMLNGRPNEMASPHKRTAARDVGGGSGSAIDAFDGSRDNATQNVKQSSSHWRTIYRVHPAADVFSMMTDDELAKLGEDIKANGLKVPISLHVSTDGDGGVMLLDGRNRLEAMERAGITIKEWEQTRGCWPDPVAHIIGLNIHRRHLKKHEQADLIVAAHKAAVPKPISRQSGEKPGRPVDEVKAAAVETAKELGIGKRTVERSFAKAEGKTPNRKRVPRPKAESDPELDQKQILTTTFSTCLPSVRQWFCEILADCKNDPDASVDALDASLRREP